METTSKRYIDVTDEAKAKLAKFFKCTETMVYMYGAQNEAYMLGCPLEWSKRFDV